MMRRQFIWIHAVTCAVTLALATPVGARTHSGQPPPHAQARDKDKDKAKKDKKSKEAKGDAHGQPRDWDPRFHGLDADGDNRISRGEWNGDDRSFANHDWNRDGVLSGSELIAGATRPNSSAAPRPGDDRDRAEFARLDSNHDNRLTRGEWTGRSGDFDRLDVNRDGVLSPYEFGVGR
jgi:hypothetical protein